MTDPVVYLSIGNSDNKLGQQEWAEFVRRIRHHVLLFCTHPGPAGPQIIGDWASASDSAWQNACWAFTLPDGTDPGRVAALRHIVALCATRYRQDTIVWADATTTFITPEDRG